VLHDGEGSEERGERNEVKTDGRGQGPEIRSEVRALGDGGIFLEKETKEERMGRIGGRFGSPI
jgi:hypothetical protein